jgi:cell division protein FtsB
MTDFIANVLIYGTAVLVGAGSAALYHFIYQAKVEHNENKLEAEIVEGNYKILELAAENTQLKEKIADLEKQIPKNNNLRVSAKQTA